MNRSKAALRRLSSLGLIILLAQSIALFYSPANADVLAKPPQVIFERVPDEGIQPKLMSDSAGNVHLIYFKRDQKDGRNRNGNLYYRQRHGAQNWSPAIKVSNEDFAHLGPVSKASSYIDDMGRIHVVWFIAGSGYLYSRSNRSRSAFEPSRSIVQEFTEGLDAEASLSGNNNLITITWHAGALTNEAARAVYSLTSNNYGESFGPEEPMSDPSLGACACCSLATQYTSNQQLQIAYRSAINNDGRHMQVVEPKSEDVQIATRTVGEWVINTCPVSSNHLLNDWLVFESESRLFQINLTTKTTAVALLESNVRQKHPVMAENKAGYRLVAWGQANGYFSGGDLTVQLFKPDETLAQMFGPTPNKTLEDFSVAAASTLQDDNFLVLY